MDDRPRITADEADARFAALIAEYRDRKTGRERAARGPLWSPTWIVVAAYLIGAVAGALGHAKPLIVVLLAVPVVLLGRAVLKRSAGLAS